MTGRVRACGDFDDAIADKLVLQRQRHLKWRAFDRLELALMIVCGVLCFGFSLSVTCDIVTRTIGHPWLWLQEVTSTLFIYAIFIGAAVATRRNDHLYLTAISEAMHGTPRLVVEIIIRLVVLGVAFCPDLVRLPQLPPRLRQFPPAVGHADRLALCGDPAVRRADRAVHHRAAGQRHAATALTIPSRRKIDRDISPVETAVQTRVQP